MTDEIKPALTAEDWASRGMLGNAQVGTARLIGDDLYADELPFRGRRRHALAALALHGQPFGFTWEDVDALQRVIDDYDPTNFPQPSSGVPRRVLVLLRARIAALLPPREGPK